MKRIQITLWLLLLSFFGSYAQDGRGHSSDNPFVQVLEYWFNDDFDSRSSTPISGLAFDTIFAEVTTATTNLDYGLNFVHYRFRDSNGLFSSITTDEFFKHPNHANMNQMEYWFNDDYAHRNTVTASSNELSAYLETDDLPFGHHFVHLRVRAENGMWSSVYSQAILKTGRTGLEDRVPRISGYRYWFDDDMSAPHAVELESNTANADLELNIPAPFTEGEHKISIQFKDNRTHLSSVISSDFRAYLPVTGISLNKTALTKTVGDSPETLIATVVPSDAANKTVTWSSSDSNVAAVSNGTVSFVSAGSATITATTQDGGFTATCAVTVQSLPDGIDNTCSPAIHLYPNPASDRLTIEHADGGHVQIYTVDGQTIYENPRLSDKEILSVASWKAGLYLVKIRTANGVVLMEKIVKE